MPLLYFGGFVKSSRCVVHPYVTGRHTTIKNNLNKLIQILIMISIGTSKRLRMHFLVPLIASFPLRILLKILRL